MDIPAPTTFSKKYLKLLFERINTLSSTEHEEILKIISTHDTHYSKNKNGVFFNLSALKESVIKEIDDFVTYCVSNKQQLDEYDKKLNECKLSNNFQSMLPQRHNLADMGKKKEEPAAPTWADIVVDESTVDKFVKYVDKMNQERDKIGKKKASMKYNTAKKRYAKRVVVERKFDNEGGELVEEAYLFPKTSHNSNST